MSGVIVLGTLFVGLALLSYSVLGFYSRYYADDYCMSGLVFQKGFWQAQIDQYMSWSNRFAGMFVLSLSEFLGHSAIKAWTALVVILLVAVLAWTISQLCRWLNLSLSRWLVVLLAELIVFFTILFAPQLYQSLFWRIGIITYTLPLIFLVLLAGMVIRFATQIPQRSRKILGMVACGAMAFLAGGFSETYLVLQISTVLLAMLAVFLLAEGVSRRKWVSMLAAVLVGSLISLTVVLASPGNAVRQAAMPPPPSLWAWAKMVLLHTFLFVYRVLDSNPFQFFLVILIPLLLVYGYYSGKLPDRQRPSSLMLVLFILPLIMFLLVSAVMAPAAYVQSSYPDGRVLIEAGFLVAMTLISMGSLIGFILSQLHQWAGDPTPGILKVWTALLALILLLYPVYDARKNAALLPEFQDRAQSWDSRDARIRAARQNGEFNIHEVANNAPAALTDIKPESSDWINICATWFYDIDSIIAINPQD